MSAKAIREFYGKQLMARWLPEYSGGKHSVEGKQVLIGPDVLEATGAWNFDVVAQENPWLLTERLVVKPDQLIKRRGKAGLLAVNKTWDEVKEWIKARMQREQQVERVTGILNHFIVETFVPHAATDEYYFCIQVGGWVLGTPRRHGTGVPQWRYAHPLSACTCSPTGMARRSCSRMRGAWTSATWTRRPSGGSQEKRCSDGAQGGDRVIPRRAGCKCPCGSRPRRSRSRRRCWATCPRSVRASWAPSSRAYSSSTAPSTSSTWRSTPWYVFTAAGGGQAAWGAAEACERACVRGGAAQVVVGDKVVPLDLAAKIDETASFLCGPQWGPLDFPAPFGRAEFPEESFIRELDSKTGSSLKLTVLNPNGRVWTMVAGGGASVVYADSIADLGFGNELANYGQSLTQAGNERRPVTPRGVRGVAGGTGG
jgi:hypothetical protein